MRKDHTFTSERLYFRGISEQDTDALVRWRSDPDVIRYFRNPTPVTREGHLKWLTGSYQNNPDRHDFIVIEKESESPIGTVGLNMSDDGLCEVSYMIAEPGFQRRGYAVEAIRAVMDEAQKEGIHAFMAEIHRDNTASIRTIERLGFTLDRRQEPFLFFVREAEGEGC